MKRTITIRGREFETEIRNGKEFIGKEILPSVIKTPANPNVEISQKLNPDKWNEQISATEADASLAAASYLGSLGKGKPKTLTQAERKRRSERLALDQRSRARTKNPKPRKNKTK